MYPHASKQGGSESAFARVMRSQKRTNSGDNTARPCLNDILLPPIAAQPPPRANPSLKAPFSVAGNASCRELSVKTPPAELLHVISELQCELGGRTDSVNAIQRNFERLSGMYRQDQAELARVTAELQALKEASKGEASKEKVLRAVQMELEDVMGKYQNLLDEVEQAKQAHQAALSAAQMQQNTLQEACEELRKNKASLSERIEMLERKNAQANADITDIHQRASLQMQEDREKQRAAVEALLRRAAMTIEECVDSIEASTSVMGTPGMALRAEDNARKDSGSVSKDEDGVAAAVDVEACEPWLEAAAQGLLSKLKVIALTFERVLSTVRKDMSDLNSSFVRSMVESAEESSRRRLEELEENERSLLQQLQQSTQELLGCASCALTQEKEASLVRERVLREQYDRLRSSTNEFAIWCESALHHVCSMNFASLDLCLEKDRMLFEVAFTSQTYVQQQVQQALERTERAHEVERSLSEAVRDHKKRIISIQTTHARTLAEKNQEENHLKAQHSRDIQLLRDNFQQCLEQKERFLNELKGDFEQSVKDFKVQVENLKVVNSNTEKRRLTEQRQLNEIINSEMAARMVIMKEEQAHFLSEECAANATLLKLVIKDCQRTHLLQQCALDELRHAEEEKRFALYFEEYQGRLSVLQSSWGEQFQRLKLAHEEEMRTVRREESLKLQEIIQARDNQHQRELDELLKQCEAAKLAETELEKELTALQCSLREEQVVNDKKRRAVSSAVGCLLSAEEASESAYSCLSCLQLLKASRTCVPCGHTFCASCLLEHPMNKGESTETGKSTVGRVHPAASLFCPECKMRNVREIVETRALEELATKFTYKTKVLRDVLAYLGPNAMEGGNALEEIPGDNAVFLSP